jgi:hypothetical protein
MGANVKITKGWPKKGKRGHLYHGTSQFRLEQMQDKGYETRLIYLAATPSGSEMYATFASDSDFLSGDTTEENTERLLELKISALLEHGELGPDWDDVAMIIRDGDGSKFPGAFEVNDVSWQESLKVLGTCSLSGDFGPAITRIFEGFR